VSPIHTTVSCAPSSGVLSSPDPLARGAFLLTTVRSSSQPSLRFAQVRALYGGDESTATRVNCPSCGSRVPAEPDACEHGGALLELAAE
jgi:hypothetical protein